MNRRGLSIASLALVPILACGAGNGDGGSDPDGGFGSCDMQIVSISPTVKSVGSSVTVRAIIDVSGFLPGASYFDSWRIFPIDDEGSGLLVVPLDPDDPSVVTFSPQVAGIHRIELAGHVGESQTGGCTDDNTMFTVQEPNANVMSYRFRFSAGQAWSVPVQDHFRLVVGGSDSQADFILDTAVPVAGHVSGPKGQPVAAYVRARVPGSLSSMSPTVESFANDDGEFAMLVVQAIYDLLVVPVDLSIAPAVVTGSTGGWANVSMTSGETVQGTVLGSDSLPIEGARLSMHVDGVPSTLAMTDSSGSFALRARGGQLAGLVVVPPAESGLFQLEVAATASLTVPASNLTVRFAASVSRSVSLIVVNSPAGDPVPQARATFRAVATPDAATVTLDGSDPITAVGSVRRTVVADGAGRVSLSIPEALYDVILEGPGGTEVRVAPLDLRAGASVPTQLVLSPRTVASGTVVAGEDRLALAGVRVIATPKGDLANIPGAGAQTWTAADGRYSLSLVDGADYRIVYAASDAAHARVEQDLLGVHSEIVVPELWMPAAVRLRGTVFVAGAPLGVAGIHIALLCGECETADADTIFAETVTVAGGEFTLAVPDPGVGDL